MQLRTIQLKKTDGVAVLTLNRPDKLNAVNLEMRREVLWVLREMASDDEVRVVIFTGAGKAFCAGADISELEAPTIPDNREVEDLVRVIYEFDKPIIGAINGVSAGAGSQWMLAFDLNVASEQAKFSWPAARLGIA